MPDIVLYDRTGKAVTYPGADSLTTDTPEVGVKAKFTYGELAEGTEIEPDFSGGDQKVTVPEGYVVREATIKKPDNFIPEHLKKGEVIAGVEGTLIGEGVEKTVNADFSGGDQVIEPDPETLLSKVTVTKPENLIPENIPKDVVIAGVKGTKEDMEAGIIMGTLSGIHCSPNVLYIPESKFRSATGEFGVSYPNCSLIGSYAFYQAHSMNSAIFDNCTTIEGSAFYQCYNLAEISFPKCTTIGSNAFVYCSSLSEAVFPVCTSITGSAFKSCGIPTVDKYTRVLFL